MPHFKKWIEAQLKRGYTKEQIKNFLIRKGYPLNAVAEVNKVRYSALPDKTLPSEKIPKKNYNSVILILAVVAVIFGVVYFMGGDKGVEEKETSQTTTTTPKTTTIQKDEKTILQEFIQENVILDYQPDSLDVSELPSVSNPDNVVSGKAYGTEWNAKWRNISIDFSAIFQYNSDNKEVSYYGVSIKMPNILTILNESTAYSIHGIFFKNEDANWVCEKIREMNVCENVIMNEDKTKRVDTLRESPPYTLILSRYNFPITSESYEIS